MITRVESEWGVEFPSLTFSSFLCPTDSARRANRRQKNAAQGRAPARPAALGTRSPAKVVLGLDAECSAACFSLPRWPLPAIGKCRRGKGGETLCQDPETAKEELASDRFRERSCAPRRRRRRRERGRGRPRAAVTEPNDAYGLGSPR